MPEIKAGPIVVYNLQPQGRVVVRYLVSLGDITGKGEKV